MTHYDTIIRYYFQVPIIFPIMMIMTHGTIIFPIIFPIISYYSSFSLFFLLFSIMTQCRHPENGNVHAEILDPFTEEWLISVD